MVLDLGPRTDPRGFSNTWEGRTHHNSRRNRDHSGTLEFGHLVSWEAQGWAWEAALAHPNDRLVLLALVEWADVEDTCFPSIASLCRRTLLSERSVIRSLRRLEDDGYLQREERQRENGSRSSNLYRLNVDIEVAARGAMKTRELQKTPAGRHPTPAHSGGDPRTQRGGAPAHRHPQNPPLLNPPLIPISIDAPEQPDPADPFIDWYARYPRKVGRANAERAYRRALKTATPEALADGLTRYLAEIDRKQTGRDYIKHPATWLNGACWDDEYAEPEEEIEFPPWSPPPPDDPSIMDDPAAYSVYVTREREKFKAEYIASRRHRASDSPGRLPAVPGRGSR